MQHIAGQWEAWRRWIAVAALTSCGVLTSPSAGASTRWRSSGSIANHGLSNATIRRLSTARRAGDRAGGSCWSGNRAVRNSLRTELRLGRAARVFQSLLGRAVLVRCSLLLRLAIAGLDSLGRGVRLRLSLCGVRIWPGLRPWIWRLWASLRLRFELRRRPRLQPITRSGIRSESCLS